MDIYVTFKLTGWHARYFMRVVEIVNMAPGPHLEASEVARRIIQAAMEADARDHDMQAEIKTARPRGIAEP